MKKTLQKTLLALTVMVCSLTGVLTPAQALASDNYVPMLREDRVWEYRSGDFGPFRENITRYHVMKVVGEATINDVTYKAFGFVREMAFDYYRNPEHPLLSDVIYNGDGIKFFLREEEGVVYELFYGDGAYYTDEVLGYLDLPEDGADGKFYSEKILYNATVANGSTVDIYIDTWHNGVSEATSLRQYYGEEIDIQGETCRVIGLFLPYHIEENDEAPYPTLDNPGYQAWIEGIGVTELGTLPCIGLYRMAGVAPQNMQEMAIVEPQLNSVYTPEGVVLFGADPVVASVAEIAQSSLSMRYADKSLVASGQGQLTLTVTGLDGVTVALATGTDEVSVATEGLERGVYVVTAKDGSSTRTLKIKI